MFRRLPTPTLPRRPRLAPSMALAAVLLHELRHLIAYDGDGTRMLAHDGHPWLAVVSPLIALLLVALLTRSLGRAGSPSWLPIAGALFGVYAAQSVVEGLVAPSQLTGLGGVLGHGGWMAVPAVVAVGWLLARTARLLHDRLVRFGPKALRPALLHAPALLAQPGRAVVAAPSAALARNLAGRAPPFALV
ncbi:hypothetical protein Q5424_25895 [Conexibacter sp. JD483]|uniref:hypothetical protein n=1 Tax=unclassified Conexibacter TaxID=2627773 RepID=UPI0027174297|nr:MULTISPECIES: hypothetical protein [unclassified Conexibacter]MDO8187790.1 hypothetical protein [Conexibacter sp. CPCC 205706]MDO8201978.1 hypothetical protein [Conexibacter sp. CPCC 205762]MDR9372558.1 hypothetical protein [Conexibacter sp. JD483]